MAARNIDSPDRWLRYVQRRWDDVEIADMKRYACLRFIEDLTANYQTRSLCEKFVCHVKWIFKLCQTQKEDTPILL